MLSLLEVALSVVVSSTLISVGGSITIAGGCDGLRSLKDQPNN
jgi:hypothetical protein